MSSVVEQGDGGGGRGPLDHWLADDRCLLGIGGHRIAARGPGIVAGYSDSPAASRAPFGRALGPSGLV